jgi:hypothetical protein
VATCPAAVERGREDMTLLVALRWSDGLTLAADKSEVHAVVAQNETRSRALLDSFYQREGRS